MPGDWFCPTLTAKSNMEEFRKRLQEKEQTSTVGRQVEPQLKSTCINSMASQVSKHKLLTRVNWRSVGEKLTCQQV
jgi:hypothetical protein